MNESAIAQPPQHTYVALEHVEKFLAYGRRLGVPVDSLLAEYRIDLRRDTNKRGYVPGHIWEEILRIGIERSRRLGNPLPGLLVAEGLGLSFTGLWAFVMETSGTFIQAIETAAAYQKLHTTAVVATLRRSPGYLDIIVAPQFHDPEVRLHTADWYLAMLALFAQHCCDSVAGLVDSVSMRRHAPDNPALQKRYRGLFNCPVRYGARENFIRIHAAALNRPLVTADGALQAVLAQQAQERLDAYNNDAMEEKARLRHELRQLLVLGQANKDQLAEALSISPRTLQRKLQAQGMSYRQLLNEVRLAEAQTLLRQSPIPISRIASKLGFHDPHSFSRWFSSQTGKAPSLARAHQG
jgi:AraC-like DNA-binding protein